MELGRVGVWTGDLRRGETAERHEAVAELEALGYGAVWLPGAFPGVGLGDVLDDSQVLLEGSSSLVVATGILNIWAHAPVDVAARCAAFGSSFPGRFLLGLGVSHQPLIPDAPPGTWEKPVAAMAAWLENLEGVPADEVVLAALGPRMLDLARERTGGAHPYLVNPEHTAFARERLGAGKLLAPDQKVVLDTDPASARQKARDGIGFYFGLPNYTNNWLRLGFTEDDLADGGSDRLIDALVVWGDEATIAARVAEHHAAGADHVCINVIGDDSRRVWRALAPALRD